MGRGEGVGGGELLMWVFTREFPFLSTLLSLSSTGEPPPPEFRKVCKTGKILPGQIQISWTILVRNNA